MCFSLTGGCPNAFYELSDWSDLMHKRDSFSSQYDVWDRPPEPLVLTRLNYSELVFPTAATFIEETSPVWRSTVVTAPICLKLREKYEVRTFTR